MPLVPRFRIRTLLVAVAVVSALAIWPAARWRAYVHEQAVIGRLEAKDAQVSRRSALPFGAHAYQITVDEYVRRGPKSGSPEEPRPEALRLSADDIRSMAGLGELRHLQLHGDVLDPKAYVVLGELKQLESLRISQGSWDDERLRYLEPLSGLRELTLEQTQTTDAGVERLQEKLPKLVIADD